MLHTMQLKCNQYATEMQGNRMQPYLDKSNKTTVDKIKND